MKDSEFVNGLGEQPDDEVWVTVPSLDGTYFITDLGRIKRTGHRNWRPKILKPNNNSWGGYYRIKVFNGIIWRTRFMHHLVAETFIANPDNKPWVNHKNGIKTDNRADNLEWCTRKENLYHAKKLGLFKTGATNHNSKPVLQILDNGQTVRFASCGEAARALGIKHQYVSSVCRGNQKSHRGMRFKFEKSVGEKVCEEITKICETQTVEV